MALALAERESKEGSSGLEIHVFHDERSAGFAAVGIGLSTGVPAIVLCSSGTAAAHLHAAVIEAHQSCLPMIVCTADRPIELRDVGAPQTIDQTHLYGRAVRWFTEPGVADESQRSTWRSMAARAVIDSTAPLPGPVHINLAFREPLLGIAGTLPEHRAGPWHRLSATGGTLPPDALAELSTLLDVPNGVIIAGRGVEDPRAVGDFAMSRGWPILADPRSGCRTPGRTTVAAFDAMLRDPTFVRDHRPDVIVRIGEPPASKVLGQWVAATGAAQVHLSRHPTWVDPDHVTALRVTGEPGGVLRQLHTAGETDPEWLEGWYAAELIAQGVLDDRLGGVDADGAVDGQQPLLEPGIARTIVASAPAGGSLVVSASMPVRDVEWFSAPRGGITVYSNRGANGIDGVLSTAIGVAFGTGAHVSLLIGDVAFLHDAPALTALANRAIDLTVVVVDNDGGGIFSFLPQGTALASECFEQLFGTPHGTDLVALCRAHHLRVSEVVTRKQLRSAMAEPFGIHVVVARTDRVANVHEHEAINTAVAEALDRLTRAT